MSQSSEILKTELDKLSADLTKRYEELGMRASGKWDKEKTVEVSEKGSVISGKIEGLEYTGALEGGRSPTTKKGKGDLRPAIEQWIKDKGISSEIPVKSLAYLIARKIHKDGWRRQEHGGVELISSVVTTERIDSIVNQVGIINIDVIVSGLVAELKKIAV